MSREHQIPKQCNSNNTNSEATKTGQLLGLFSAMISGLSIAAISVCRKYLPDLSATQFVIYRYAGVLCYSLLATLYYRQTILLSKKITFLLALRGSLMGLCYIIGSLALNYIPITEYSVVAGSCPVFTIVLARIILKERCNVIHIICMALTSLGIILVSKLPLIIVERTSVYEVSYFGGIASTLLFSFITAVSVVIIRTQKVKTVHSSVVVFYVGALSICECVILSSIVFGFTEIECDLKKWIPVILFVVGITNDIFVLLALKYLQSSVCIMVSTAFNILGSYLWEVLAEGDVPDMYTISGTAVTIVCIVLLTVGETIKSYQVNWRIFVTSLFRIC